MVTFLPKLSKTYVKMVRFLKYDAKSCLFLIPARSTTKLCTWANLGWKVPNGYHFSVSCPIGTKFKNWVSYINNRLHKNFQVKLSIIVASGGKTKFSTQIFAHSKKKHVHKRTKKMAYWSVLDRKITHISIFLEYFLIKWYFTDAHWNW